MNPIRSAIALVSPSDPLSVPTNMVESVGSVLPKLSLESTVADETASVADSKTGAGQVVICAGNEMSKNIRPTRAGLKMFLPKPPKDIFPMPMAANAPIARIHIGRFDGTLNASSTPVMMADPSLIVGSFFNMNLEIKYSNTTQNNMEANVNISASSLNTYSDNKNAGISAISTPYMFFGMLSPLCMCGEGDTINLFSIKTYSNRGRYRLL